MHSFTYFYQHLPYHLDPTALSVGFFSVTWYSLMYVAAFVTVYLLLMFRIKKGESPPGMEKNIIFDYLLWAFVGLLIGARLGEVLFYNFNHYLHHPLAIISPFDPATGEFVGIYGMSYHGGVIGVILATLIFLRKKKVGFWQFADFVAPAIPLGYFWGRIGNFLNGELYGRVTDSSWGMYFPSDPMNYFKITTLRYPSQLLEAFLEGIVLFAILWPMRNSKYLRGRFIFVYIIGYSVARSVAEFFREPDGYVFNFITIGQFLSLIFIISALAVWKISKKVV